jgi:putative two-component system response regulator
VRQAQAKLERVSAASLDALVLALESKDPYMAGHSIRVAHVAASIAAEMGRSDEDVEVMRLAGRLHDIGVVGISDGILAKQAALTPAEFAEVKRHVTIGAQILAPYTHLGEVAEFVRGHHERWDGTGYPDGLSGEHIPWGARILAAAEIHDAITSARPYRERIPLEEAILQMASMSGTTLEPAVYRALANVVDRGQALDFLTEAHGGESETQMSLAAAAS